MSARSPNNKIAFKLKSLKFETFSIFEEFYEPFLSRIFLHMTPVSMCKIQIVMLVIVHSAEYGSGRYTGFGNTKQSQSTPMSPIHSGNEVVDNTLASLATVSPDAAHYTWSLVLLYFKKFAFSFHRYTDSVNNWLLKCMYRWHFVLFSLCQEG